jgi:hypothetical protein
MPLDGETMMELAREALGGIPEERSKFAPLTDEMKAVRAKYAECMNEAPEGAVVEIPYTQSEEPSEELARLMAPLERELLAETRAREAIKNTEPKP